MQNNVFVLRDPARNVAFLPPPPDKASSSGTLGPIKQIYVIMQALRCVIAIVLKHCCTAGCTHGPLAMNFVGSYPPQRGSMGLT